MAAKTWRLITLFSGMIVCLLAFPAGAARAQQLPGATASAALVALAAAEVQSVQETHYTHHSSIDHAAGIYDTDCSGFVDDLLRQVAPDAYSAIPVEAGWAEPRAYKFAEFFAALQTAGDEGGWTAVPYLSDAKPGDILAWSLAPFTPGSDTGHVVVLAAAPQLNRDGSYSVPVYDASSILHAHDSRARGHGGVGSGNITIVVDAMGMPVAFQFNLHDQVHTTLIAIGRLTGNNESWAVPIQ